MGMLRKLDEARFFYPIEQATTFAAIGQLVQAHEMSLSNWRLNNDDDQTRIREGDNMANISEALNKLRVELPKLMEKELGFAQVTSRTV